MAGLGAYPAPELTQRDGGNLAARMTRVNEARELTRRVPSEAQVANWTTQAKARPAL